MKKMILVFVGILFLLFFTRSVFSQINLDLYKNKGVYSLNERVVISLYITSTNDEKDIKIQGLLKSIDENYIYYPSPIIISLEANKSTNVEVFNFSVDDNFRYGIYQIEVFAYKNTDKKYFVNDSIIINGLKDFEYKILFCKDKACKKQSKFFYDNEKIYLNFKTNIVDLQKIIELYYPNNIKKNISLPITLEDLNPGTYKILSYLKKEGYQEKDIKDEFIVIKKSVEKDNIKKVHFNPETCNINGVCDSQEDYQSCPQDCSVKSKEISNKKTIKDPKYFIDKPLKNDFKSPFLFFIFLFFILILLIVIILIIIYFFKKPLFK